MAARLDKNIEKELLVRHFMSSSILFYLAIKGSFESWCL